MKKSTVDMNKSGEGDDLLPPPRRTGRVLTLDRDQLQMINSNRKLISAKEKLLGSMHSRRSLKMKRSIAGRESFKRLTSQKQQFGRRRSSAQIDVKGIARILL